MGRIRSVERWAAGRHIPEHITVGHKAPNGYRNIGISGPGFKGQKTMLVHRLVLETFIGMCPDGMECNHKNGNKEDNRLENLEWVTKSSNQEHLCQALGKRRGETHGMSKLTEEKVKAIRADPRSHRLVALDFGVSKSLVSQVRSRGIWAHVP